MKISENKSDDVTITPKLRNINEEKEEIIEEKPEGPDKRLVIAAGAIFLFILFIGIKGSITNSSLSSQLEEQKKLNTEVKAEALLYGITEDEDGELMVPESQEPVDVADIDWDSVEQRNKELLKSFTTLLFNWKGKDEYEAVREKLISEWKFSEDSHLLTTFMRELTEDDLDEKGMFNKNISFRGDDRDLKSFVLENHGKNEPMSYFLVCTVRTSIKNKGVTGSVGVRITINANGTISNVTVQTLS